MMDVRGKKIAVIGMGKSGIEAARFLKRKRAELFISEGRRTERTKRAAETLEKEGFELELGRHSIEKICRSDFVIISPGISPRQPVYQAVKESSAPLLSEIEVASWYLNQPIIAVTGTNGKTTVTSLITQMLNDCGKPALSAGNIGNPLIGEIEKIEKGKMIPVVEVSSFQRSRNHS